MEEVQNEDERRLIEEQKKLKVIDLIIADSPELQEYVNYTDVLRVQKRKEIEEKLENRLSYESKLQYLESEHKTILKRWEHKFNEGIRITFFSTYEELENIALSYKHIQKDISLTIDQFDDDIVKVKWYERHKRKSLKKKVIALMKGELSDDEAISLMPYLNTDKFPKEAIGLFNGDFNGFGQYLIGLYDDKIMLKFFKDCIIHLENYNEECNEEFSSPIYVNTKKGNKIDMIRILLAMYDSNMLQKENGDRFMQDEFMKEAGKLFNMDLSSYQNDLQTALANTIEANVSIFKRLEKHIVERHGKKN